MLKKVECYVVVVVLCVCVCVSMCVVCIEECFAAICIKFEGNLKEKKKHKIKKIKYFPVHYQI